MIKRSLQVRLLWIYQNLYVYALTQNSVTFSYFKCPKEKIKVSGVLIDFLNLLSSVPEGSILGPILFNIFLTLKSSKIYNVPDDDAISKSAKHIDDLLLTLRHGSEQAAWWFTQTLMIVNSHKFQSTVL